jgi:hypothetical protein
VRATNMHACLPDKIGAHHRKWQVLSGGTGKGRWTRPVGVSESNDERDQGLAGQPKHRASLQPGSSHDSTGELATNYTAGWNEWPRTIAIPTTLKEKVAKQVRKPRHARCLQAVCHGATPRRYSTFA